VTTLERPRTVGELKASGYQVLPVREEMRKNLIAKIRSGEDIFPGIFGYEETVAPHIVNAILAGQDIIFLGERGQAKSRIIRSLTSLLDDATPALAGCEIPENPFDPITKAGRDIIEAEGDSAQLVWLERDGRYGEKLATPDITIADLIGEVDPIKVAEGRYLSDELTIHYGLIPRTNRGIFCINELPDLAERIQVGLLNIMEERDVQIRGYRIRLPLDVFIVASANPEDYTNRGRIITPLKDRFGAEIRTHYPLRLDDEVALIRQEAQLGWAEGPLRTPVVPDHILEIIARFARAVRRAPQIDARSGVSARFAIAAAETAAASAVRRAAITGERTAVVRVADLPATVPAALGKVEFDQMEEGRELELLNHLLRRATSETFRARLGGSDLSGLLARFDEGATVETGDLTPAADLLARIGPVPGLSKLLDRLGMDAAAEEPGLVAAALELTLEGLHLNKRLAKEELPGRTVYGR
jgi:magnesium chelatase subunit I